MNSTQKKLAQNTLVQVVGKVLSTIFGVATLAVLTRYLGADGYGQFTLVITFLSIFAVIVDFGLTLTTVQMISEKKADEPRILGNLLSLRIISAVLFLSLAPIIAIYFPYSPVVKIAIAVGALSYLFGTTSQLFLGVFQKRLMMGRVMVAELLNRGAVLIGALLAPFFGLDLVGVIWILVIGNALQLLVMSLLTARYIPLSFRLDFPLLRNILWRSWPIGASIFFNLIYLRGDIIFLSFYRTSEEIGLYGAAYKVIDVVTTIPVMYMGVALPILTLAFSQSALKKFSGTMQESFDFFAILAIPFVFGSIALGVPIMEFIAGEEFTESGRVLAILGPAASVVFFGALFGHAIVAVQKQRVMTWGYFAVAVLTIIGYLVFIPSYGMYGAAWMTLFAEATITLLTFTVVLRTSGFRPKMRLIGKAIIASLFMYAFLVLANLHVVLIALLGSLLYFFILSLLGGFDPKKFLLLFLPEKPPIQA